MKSVWEEQADAGGDVDDFGEEAVVVGADTVFGGASEKTEVAPPPGGVEELRHIDGGDIRRR